MSEKYEKQKFFFRNLVCDWFSHNGHTPADAESKVKFLVKNLPFI